MAVEKAKADGIDTLTDKHWQVIEFMRKEYFSRRARGRRSECSARHPASR
ncbi:MAG: TusE/DsrC/DsvC family sulfur relay protein [Ilumatobacteraceae bacterium]